MTLKDTDKVDIVAKTPGGAGELIIVDAGDAQDEEQRHYLLTQKLLSYANYVADGQYRAELPGVAADAMTIRVICRTQPNQSMAQINSIATRQEPILRIPVVFEAESEFFARTRAARRVEEAVDRPWWKFW